MKKTAFALCAVSASLIYAASVTGAIDKDIRKTQSNIDAKSKEYTKLTSSIGEAAREILAEQEKIKSLDAQIVALEQDVIRLGEEHKQKNAEVAVIEAQKKKLENERDDLEQKLVKILARDMAASKVLSEVDPSEEDDIVKAHLSKSISKTLAAYVEKLRSEYVARQKMIAELEQKIRQIKVLPKYGPIPSMLIYALISSSFTIFFGGSLPDAAVSGMIGIGIRCVELLLQPLPLNRFLLVVLLSTVSGCMAASCVYTNAMFSLDKISIGNIMILIPGLMFTNCIREMISENMLSGLTRLLEALFISSSIAIGFAIAYYLL